MRTVVRGPGRLLRSARQDYLGISAIQAVKACAGPAFGLRTLQYLGVSRSTAGATAWRSRRMILMYFTERPYRYVPEDEVIKHGGFFGLPNRFFDSEKGA